MTTLEQQFKKIIKPLTKELVNAALTWTLDNFKKQQWEGSKWQPRKKETKLSKGKDILTGRRDLYNAIQIVSESSFGVVGIPYAIIHNQGGSVNHPARSRQMTFKKYKKGKFKGKTLFHKNNEKASFSKKTQGKAYAINIPKRQFIGNNAAMRQHMVAEGQKWVNNR